jgi:two-component system, response regulator FlrC
MRHDDGKQAPLPGLDGAGDMVGRTLAEVERRLILETLRQCHGNRTRAATILGISIRTLRNKLNEYAADGASIPPAGGAAQFEGAA